MKKRLLSLILVLAVFMSILPNALAADSTLPLNSQTTGYITETNRQNNYSMTLTESGRLNLSITAYMQNYCIKVFDSNGTQIWYTDLNTWTESVGYQTGLHNLDLEAGTYKVEVNGYLYRTTTSGSGSTGSYTLSNTFTASGATNSEPDNSVDTATPMNLNSSMQGQIAINDPYDVYSVTLQKSGRLNLSITAYMKNYCIKVFDNAGTEIWYSDLNTWTESVGYQIDTYDLDLEAGTYYIQVNGYLYRTTNSGNGSTGNYTLTNTFTGSGASNNEPDNSFSTATPIGMGSTVKGQIAINDQYDTYTFNISQSQEVYLSIIAYMKNYCIKVYDSTGSEIWYTDLNTWTESVGYQSGTHSVALTAGTYYIQINGYLYKSTTSGSGSTGNYSFKLSLDGSAPEYNPGSSLPFNDVESDKWYYNSVEYVYNNNLMDGTSSTDFEPESTLSRAMVATVLYRMAGEPSVSYRNIFNDVSSGYWYSNAVIWAYDNGIVDGYNPTTFGTNDNITREQFATMLYRYAIYKGNDTSYSTNLSSYKDSSSISSWALDAMYWSVEKELITGVTGTTLVPDGSATRSQCAAILMRFKENIG